MIPFVLPLAWEWVLPYVYPTHVTCVENLLTNLGVTPRVIKCQTMSSIVHWHQQTFPADWNCQACTELMETTLMGRPWFSGQMGGSWCGPPPAWTPFVTPTIKQLPRKRVGKRCMQRLRKPGSTPIWTEQSSSNQLSGNLQCDRPRLHVLSPWPWQETEVSHRRAPLFHLPPPVDLCGDPGQQFDFSPGVSPRPWYLGSLLVSTLLVLSFSLVSLC